MNPDPTSLDRLHDLVAPPPVPWWPPAPIWYFVLGLALIVAFRLLYRGVARWQHNRYRREALAELAEREKELGDRSQRAAALAALAELLKRTAITAFPRAEVAGLTGKAWSAFLDRTSPVPSASHPFMNAPASVGTCAELMEGAAYDGGSTTEVGDDKISEMTRVVRHWLTHHHPETADGGGRRHD